MQINDFRDWLERNGARLSFNSTRLELDGKEILLGIRINKESSVVTAEDIVVRPRTAISCHDKLSSTGEHGKTLQITPVNDPFFKKGEIPLCESVVKADDTDQIPIMMANTTNATIRIFKDREVGKTITATIREQPINKTNYSDGNINLVNVEEIVIPEEYKKIVTFINKNKDVVANSDKELGQTQSVQMKIDTGDDPPIKLKPYQTLLHKRKLVEDVVEDMLETGVIERSTSLWSFPITVISKKDGRHRFCVDFRALNNTTKLLAYPLPLIDDILALFGNSAYFSTLDLRSGYWQVASDEVDREKAAFACHVGLYQFRVMLFRLANAPGIFQQFMSVIFGGLEQFAMAYLDDILVFSRSADEHLRHLQTVFGRLRRHGLVTVLQVDWRY